MQFSWAAINGATHYKLYEDPDGASGFTQLGANIAGTSATKDIAVHLQNWTSARYRVDACNTGGCTPSTPVGAAAGVLQAIGYFKASNTEAGDSFGVGGIALSGDGNTLAVGANGEDSIATGIDGNQTDNSRNFAGAVYVYVRSGATWIQQAYVKASNTGGGDLFGAQVSLSTDGNTMAVAARQESSDATGIDGANNNNAVNSGAVYVFTRTGATWAQQAFIKASNTGAGDSFGYSMSLSGDGNTLAVAAPFEDGNGTSEADNTATDSGAVYVFARNAGVWSQQQYLKASNVGAGDQCGFLNRAVALSRDGNTLAFGCPFEDSNATGIGGDETNNSAANSGAVYVFVRNGNAWTKQAYVKASNAEAEDRFGLDVALNADGNTLAVGALGESSGATGINGNQADNSAPRAGALYVFTRSNATWSQQAYIKASNTEASDPVTNDQFGISPRLSDDGNTLVVGAYLEDSGATGVDGDQADDSVVDSGALYVFSRNGTTWSQRSYIKATNPSTNDQFGVRIALSADGKTLATSAWQEDSNATGINGNQADDSAVDSGAVYLY